MTHSEIVEAAYRWVLSGTKCKVALKEPKAIMDTRYAGAEEPDVIAFGPYGQSVVIECKVSRQDYLADNDKTFRRNPELGMGRQRYYCCPENLIKKDELPRGWGLVYVSPENNRAYIAYDPDDEEPEIKRRFERDIQREIAVMYHALKKMSFLGCLDRLYENKSPVSSSGGKPMVEEGIWYKSGSPNQKVQVVESNEGALRLGLVTFKSVKTGFVDTLPVKKFLSTYKKENP